MADMMAPAGLLEHFADLEDPRSLLAARCSLLAARFAGIVVSGHRLHSQWG